MNQLDQGFEALLRGFDEFICGSIALRFQFGPGSIAGIIGLVFLLVILYKRLVRK